MAEIGQSLKMEEETMQQSEKLKDSFEKYSYERKIKMHQEQHLFFSHSLLKVLWNINR